MLDIVGIFLFLSITGDSDNEPGLGTTVLVGRTFFLVNFQT